MRASRFRRQTAGSLNELFEFVPPQRCILDAAELRVYECDAFTLHKQAPSAVVLCESREEVAGVIRWCGRNGVPFAPRGAGTGLSGGATPPPGSVVIDVNRMRRIIRIDAENRLAVVEPGVLNLALSEAAALHDLQYAPDPSSQGACTIGGNIAENAGGPHCLKYGVTADHIIELEVVLPDGSVLRLGGPGASSGPLDLAGFFAGSEGTLGIVTEATVRLIDRLPCVRTILAVFDSMSLACRTVADITRRGILPVALEILDRKAIQVVEASVFAAGYPTEAEAVLLIELEGLGPGMADDEETLQRLAASNRAIELRAARDDTERELLWKGRKSAYGAMGRINTDIHILDGVVPRTRLEEVLASFDEIGQRHDLAVCNFFHAGDGNVHPSISYDGRDPTQVERVKAASRDICKVCVDAGGTISGEHGIGLEKIDFLSMMFRPHELDLERALRRAVDPSGIANPGKLIPPASLTPAGAGDPTADDGDAAADGQAASCPARAIEPREVPSSEQESAFYGPEVPIVAPESEDDLVEIVRQAARDRVRVVPCGLGAHAYLGNPPDAGMLGVSVRNLRGVPRYEPEDFTIGVQAGLPLAELQALLAENGQELPLAPPASGKRELRGTSGGWVAAAPPSPRWGPDAAVGNLLIGAKVLCGDARVVRAGGMVVKNVAGYNLTRLLPGSLGTIGILLEVNFKLRPVPRRREGGNAGFASAEDAWEFARRLRAWGLRPAALWVLAGGSVRVAWIFEGNEQEVEQQQREAAARLQGLESGTIELLDGDGADSLLQDLAALGEPGTSPADAALTGIARLHTLPSAARRVQEAILAAAERHSNVPATVACDLLAGTVTVRWGTCPRSRLAPEGLVVHLQDIARREAGGGALVYLRPQSRRRFDHLLAEDPGRALALKLVKAWDPGGTLFAGRLYGQTRAASGSAMETGA